MILDIGELIKSHEEKEVQYDRVGALPESIKMTRGAWKKILRMQKGVVREIGNYEWYAWLLSDQENLEIVRDILVPKQKVSHGNVDVDSFDVQEGSDELREKFPGYSPVGWIHSHGNMQVFFSPKDESNHETVLSFVSPHTYTPTGIRSERAWPVKKTEEMDDFGKTYVLVPEELDTEIFDGFRVAFMEGNSWAYAIVVNSQNQLKAAIIKNKEHGIEQAKVGIKFVNGPEPLEEDLDELIRSRLERMGFTGWFRSKKREELARTPSFYSSESQVRLFFRDSGDPLGIQAQDAEGIEEMTEVFQEVLGDRNFIAYNKGENPDFVVKNQEAVRFSFDSDAQTIFMGAISGEILYLGEEGLYVFKNGNPEPVCGKPIINKIYGMHLIDDRIKGIIESSGKFYYGTFCSGHYRGEMKFETNPAELFGDKQMRKIFVVDAMIARPRYVYQIPDHLLSVSGPPKPGVVYDLSINNREIGHSPILYDVQTGSLAPLTQHPEQTRDLRLVVQRDDKEIRVYDSGCEFRSQEVCKTFPYNSVSIFDNLLHDIEVKESE